MRILSIGLSLPDSQIDNYDWGSSLSLFDYDALIVEPAAGVSAFIEDVSGLGTKHLTYTEEPIEDGPTSASSVGLADLLRQRRDEVERLLARGGMIVVFAQPDVPHAKVLGFNGAHRYYWLPAPAGADYSARNLRPASGRTLELSDYDSPFADYLESLGSNLLFRVAFDESAFGSAGRVIARSAPGGVAVAIDLKVGGGRVVFVPAIASNLGMSERATIASGLVTAIRNATLLAAEEGTPYWLNDYKLAGLEDARTHRDELDAQIEALESDLTTARNEYRALDRYRRLLWQEGKYGLDLPVRDALTLLGLTNESSPDEPATFTYEGETVIVESAGSQSFVGINSHYRLRERIEASIASGKGRPKALLVVNGHRGQSPQSRPTQYEDPLRIAAETMRYSLVQANELYDAVARKLENPSADMSGFVRAMLAAEGAFVPPTADAEPEETPVTTESAAEATGNGSEPPVSEAASEDASEPIITAEVTGSPPEETTPPATRENR